MAYVIEKTYTSNNNNDLGVPLIRPVNIRGHNYIPTLRTLFEFNGVTVQIDSLEFLLEESNSKKKEIDISILPNSVGHMMVPLQKEDYTKVDFALYLAKAQYVLNMAVPGMTRQDMKRLYDRLWDASRKDISEHIKILTEVRK